DMAGGNSMSDEDYLDSLLKSITGKTSEKTDSIDFESDFEKALAKELNQVENEDDFLNKIENDLFSSNEVSDVSDGFSNEYLNLDEGMEASKDSKYNIDNEILENSDDEDSHNNSKNKKKSKKGLFGRKKDKDILIEDNKESQKLSLDSENQKLSLDSENQVNEETDFDVFENSDSLSGLDNSTEDLSISAEDIDDDLLSSLESIANSNEEAFEDAYSVTDSTDSLSFGEDASETPENQVSELMDILGASTEEKEKDKKSKKKEKKEKKGLFSKKKKKETDDINNPASNDAEEGFDNGMYGEGLDDSLAFFDEPEKNDSDSQVLSETESFDFGFDLGFDEENEKEKELNENEHLIRQMDRGEIDEDELLDEKETSKKKKKEKKPKVKKVKSAKKKKPKKPKKPKNIKEKDPDVIIPIPKTLIIFSFSFIILLAVVLIFGGKLNYYNNKIKQATAYYVNKNYSAAYSEIAGIDIKDEDIDFYNQIFTVMLVMRHYESGKSLVDLGDYENALDSYLKGISFYDKYQNQGRELECFDEMTEILGFIDTELLNVYGLSESEARQLVLIEDREQYAYNVRILAKEVREKMAEEKDDSNN
ncbi:MAG: hypothetical protein K2J91_03200, partial [Lachnospiraceae bacterium]|nr:hypothetical protein [Lachnospiraceae bacterium]